MSLRNRILVLVGGFALTAMIVAGLGIVTINDYTRMMRDYDRAYESAWRGERLNHLISNVVMETRGIYMARDNDELNGYVTGMTTNLDAMEGFLADWTAHAGAGDVARLDDIRTQSRNFIAARRQIAVLAAQGRVAEAETLGRANRSDRIRFQATVDGIVKATQGDLDAAKSEAALYGRQRAVDLFVMSFIGIALMTAVSLWMIGRFITAPLHALATAIVRTSKGEYDTPMDDSGGRDEVAGVWQALKVLKERSIEAERLAAAQRDAERLHERELRQILLD